MAVDILIESHFIGKWISQVILLIPRNNRFFFSANSVMISPITKSTAFEFFLKPLLEQIEDCKISEVIESLFESGNTVAAQGVAAQ